MWAENLLQRSLSHKGKKVEVSDITTGLNTIYHALRAAARALNIDIRYTEKKKGFPRHFNPGEVPRIVGLRVPFEREGVTLLAWEFTTEREPSVRTSLGRTLKWLRSQF